MRLAQISVLQTPARTQVEEKFNIYRAIIAWKIGN